MAGNRVPFVPGVDFYGNGQVSQFRIDGEGFPNPPVIDGVTGEPVVRHSELEIILALQKARGFRSIAAQLLNMTQRGLMKRIQENESLKDVVRDIEHSWIDHVEIKLFEAVDEGNVEAIKFFLKCKGRRRGWVDRREVMMGVTVGEFDEASKPPNLVLGFVEAVNPNAPSGTVGAVITPATSDDGSSSTATTTSGRTEGNGSGR